MLLISLKEGEDYEDLGIKVFSSLAREYNLGYLKYII